MYFNDIVIIGSNVKGNNKVKEFIGLHFHTKDLGALKYFFGIKGPRLKQGINLCQRKYVTCLLSEIGLLEYVIDLLSEI